MRREHHLARIGGYSDEDEYNVGALVHSSATNAMSRIRNPTGHLDDEEEDEEDIQSQLRSLFLKELGVDRKICTANCAHCLGTRKLPL